LAKAAASPPAPSAEQVERMERNKQAALAKARAKAQEKKNHQAQIIVEAPVSLDVATAPIVRLPRV